MQSIEGSANRALFYQSHLDRVSRSFAFCIARLDGTLRERVGLSYLLCRILDTVEDAQWISFQDQDRAFRQFDDFLVGRTTIEKVKYWVDAFPTGPVGVAEAEARLLQDAHEVFRDFHQLPESTRLPLTRLILSMSAGMRHYMERKARCGSLVLANAADVNRYCFFVAGLVGEILMRFLEKDIQPGLLRLRDAFRFGLFLQKVNLLKDQSADEQSGKFLVPSRSVLLRSLASDGESALRFLLALPEREVGFRLFCAWSLFIGLATLPRIQTHSGKLPREETFRLMAAVESRIRDNQALAHLFSDLKPRGLSAENDEARESDLEEGTLLGLYRGELAKSDVLAIFRAEMG